MTKIYNVAIVGGGASGLICAIELVSGPSSLLGEDVIVLEKNDRVGKKLIATGNGQGNLTNANISQDNYYGDRVFINQFIANLNQISLQEYLYKIGIPLCTDEDGRQFPLSKQASSVLDIFRSYLSSKGVTEQTNFNVINVKKEKDLYKISSNNSFVYAKNVVLAVGGKTAKQFGTDGTSYALAQNFGHKLTPLYPSLVQLKTDTSKIKGLKGLKEQVKVTAYDGNKKLKSTVGEVLFTDYGLSGNAIFKISSQVVSAKEPSLKLEFLPSLTIEQTEKIIKDRLENNVHVPKAEILTGILNKRIGQALLKGVNYSVNNIVNAIKNFTIQVTGNTGFNYAQVTKGGIDTCDVDAFNYQSKLAKGVYLIGEMLNVDGDCGGYNLTFAFITGIKVAKTIKGE